MTFERQEFTDLVGEKAQERLNGQRTNLEMIQQAAVHTQYVTGNEHWDIFLRYIQAGIERLQSVEATHRARLEASDLVDANEIMVVKIALIETVTTIKAWKAILELPKDLIKHGDDAKELLDRLDG